VERKNDDNWVKRCMTMDINYNALDKGGLTEEDLVQEENDEFGLSQEDAQCRNKRRRKTKGDWLTKIH